MNIRAMAGTIARMERLTNRDGRWLPKASTLLLPTSVVIVVEANGMETG